MRPREVVAAWVEAFNNDDADLLASYYSEGAVNHQTPEEPVVGRDAIREMFARGFATARMTCIVEHSSRKPTGRFSSGAIRSDYEVAGSFRFGTAGSFSNEATGTS